MGFISRGAFSPDNIEETWESEKGPIWVSFTLNGTQHRIHPEYLNPGPDFIDVSILRDINRLIVGTGYQFEVQDALDEDQAAFIVVLTADEKEKLERERGWRFVRWEE